MYTRFSVGGSSRRMKRPKVTNTQREAEELANKRKQIQNQLECWRVARAKDERVSQVIVRKVATSDPSGRRGEIYRAMHVECDRVWAERIQLKKAELAALMTSPSLPR
jgi:hypothetical protein